MHYADKIEAYRVINASNDNAIKWLEDNTLVAPPTFQDWIEPNHVIEYLLFRRTQQDLNLAIARYGTYVPILRRLYRNGDNIIRLAVLTNVRVGPQPNRVEPITVLTKNDLINLLNAFPQKQQHIQAYFENPHIDRDALVRLLHRENEFSFIEDLLLLHIVYHLSRNPIIAEPWDDTILDGFSEYSHNRLFLALLRLTNIVPTEQDWAYVLTKIVEEVHIPFLPDEVNIDTIRRWHIEETNPENGDTTKAKKRANDPQLNDSFWLRYAIGKRLCQEGHSASQQITVEDHDQAVRLAYFGACRPEDLFGFCIYDQNFDYPPFRNIEDYADYLGDKERSVLDQCLRHFERDGNDFIEEIIRNDEFWRRLKERELLHTLAWDLADDPNATMELPNLLRTKEATLMEKKPEIFGHDNDKEAPEQTLQEKLDRLAEEIKSINNNKEHNRIDELMRRESDSLKDIIEEVNERLDRSSERIEQQLNERTVEEALLSISERIETIAQKIERPSWSLVVMALVLGGIIGAWFGVS